MAEPKKTEYITFRVTPELKRFLHEHMVGEFAGFTESQMAEYFIRLGGRIEDENKAILAMVKNKKNDDLNVLPTESIPFIDPYTGEKITDNKEGKKKA